MVIREGGTRAFHRPAEDMIAMPDRDRFRGTATEGWYGVLLHELTHWTGAATRLDRTFAARLVDANFCPVKDLPHFYGILAVEWIYTPSHWKSEKALAIGSWIGSPLIMIRGRFLSA